MIIDIALIVEYRSLYRNDLILSVYVVYINFLSVSVTRSHTWLKIYISDELCADFMLCLINQLRFEMTYFSVTWMVWSTYDGHFICNYTLICLLVITNCAFRATVILPYDSFLFVMSGNVRYIGVDVQTLVACYTYKHSMTLKNIYHHGNNRYRSIHQMTPTLLMSYILNYRLYWG